MKKLLAALTCTTQFAAVGAAFADEPFVLSSAALDSITASGTVNFNTNVFKNVNLNKNVTLNVNKNVTSNVSITGTLATAEASADAVGFANNLAETDTFAQVQFGGAFSFSESLAAGSGAITTPTP